MPILMQCSTRAIGVVNLVPSFPHLLLLRLEEALVFAMLKMVIKLSEAPITLLANSSLVLRINIEWVLPVMLVPLPPQVLLVLLVCLLASVQRITTWIPLTGLALIVQLLQLLLRDPFPLPTAPVLPRAIFKMAFVKPVLLGLIVLMERSLLVLPILHLLLKVIGSNNALVSLAFLPFHILIQSDGVAWILPFLCNIIGLDTLPVKVLE